MRQFLISLLIDDARLAQYCLYNLGQYQWN